MTAHVAKPLPVPHTATMNAAEAGLPPVKYGEFKPLAEVMSQQKLGAFYDARGLVGNDTVGMLLPEFGYHGALDELNERLQQMGFRRVRDHIMGGSNAIVLVGHDHQMARIMDVHERKHDVLANERPDASFLLQPIAHETLRLSSKGVMNIEVLPEVLTLEDVINHPKLAEAMHMRKDVLGHAREMVETLMARCKASGLVLWDPKPENIAVVLNENNQPVPLVLDAGAVLEPEHMIRGHWKNAERSFSRYRILFGDYGQHVPWDFVDRTGYGAIEAYVNQLAAGDAREPEYFARAQEAHLQRLGLSEGEVANVLTPAQLEARKADYVQQHDAAKAAYEKQCGDAQPQVQSSPLQAEYQPQHSLKYRLLEEGVTPNELRSMGQEMQKEALPGTFCERLAAVAARRGVHKHPHDGGLYER